MNRPDMALSTIRLIVYPEHARYSASRNHETPPKEATSHDLSFLGFSRKLDHNRRVYSKRTVGQQQLTIDASKDHHYPADVDNL
jgi:hypothetical protein